MARDRQTKKVGWKSWPGHITDYPTSLFTRNQETWLACV